MKRTIFNLILLAMLFFPVSGFALEFLWTDDYGSRIFECGGMRVGGRTAVKDRGRGIYRVKGALINREVRANSIFEAAKIGCGEAEELLPVEQEPVMDEENEEK